MLSMCRGVAACLLALFVISCDGLFVSPSDPSITYSPFNWLVEPNSSTTINAGAYFRTLFTGDTVTLHFNVSQMISIPSQLRIRVDTSPWTSYLIADTIQVFVPVNLTNADLPYHTLEVAVKSVDGKYNRWMAAGQSARVVFLGIETVADNTTDAWLSATSNILIYGDSITEGQLTLGQHAGSFDTDNSDATLCWSYRLGALLGAEVGVVGFGGSGVLKEGGGNVPGLIDSWNFMWENVPRNFSAPPGPLLIILNEGTNDGNANVTAPLIQILEGLLAAAPSAQIAVMRPFDGTAENSTRSAVSGALGCAGRCVWVNTTGVYNKKYGGALHPTGANDVARVAPGVARLLRAALGESRW